MHHVIHPLEGHLDAASQFRLADAEVQRKQIRYSTLIETECWPFRSPFS
jgi:hypothetical protein